MSRLSVIVLIAVCVLFALSWAVRAGVTDGDTSVRDAFLVTLSAFMTLAILDFQRFRKYLTDKYRVGRA